jgi:integrase/recombinase XerD
MAAGLAIYIRPKTGTSYRPYKRVEERRGVKTGTFDGPFYIRPTNTDGSQPWVKLDAQSFEHAKGERDRKERGEKIAAETPSNRVNIGAAIASFIDSKKRKSRATIQNYTAILNEFLDHITIKFIDEITSKVIDEYITWLEKEREAAPKTIKNKTQVVVFMMKAAGVQKPSSIVKDLVPTVEEEPAEPYNQTDLETLFEFMEAEDQEAFQRYTFFLVTAAREKEVAHAQWKDIVMKGTVPHFVIQAKTYTKENGTKGAFSPKSHERREVPLTRELVDMLTARKKTSKSDWIFPNQNGDPEGHFLRKFKKVAFEAKLNCGKCKTTRQEGRYDKQTVEKVCSTYNEGCELHYLHRLRKTRATFWHTHQVPLRTIQYWLGHKDLNTTQKYLGIENSEAVVDKINKPMF